jgi:hypothetical protein
MRVNTLGLSAALALGFALSSLTGCASTPCTLAPLAPSWGDVPSDWSATVRPNCLRNIQRVSRWLGGGAALKPTENPARYFDPVGAGSIGGGTSPVDVRVIVHGWAPGYLPAVQAANRNIVWWGSHASVDGTWASNWAWTPTMVGNFPVSTTGLFQQAQLQNPGAIVLGFSWIDDSATSSTDISNLTEVYQSEAHTNIAGIRLANALDQVLAKDFWKNPNNRLHLIGHSHGAKVATVAAQLLQQRHSNDLKKGSDHLTTLDSPESEATLVANGANLIGFYVKDLNVDSDYLSPTPGTIFVDNYVSYFGGAYVSKESNNPINDVLNVMLYPWTLSSSPEFGHSYSAQWYGGAAPSAKISTGLSWPPVPTHYVPPALTPYFNQAWFRSGEKTQAQQWKLEFANAAGAARAVFGFGTAEATIKDQGDATGNVSFDKDNNRLTLSASGPKGSGPARFHGSYANRLTSSNYGLGFNLTWTDPANGDYLVVTVSSSNVTSAQEVILVLDGRSLAGAATPNLKSVPVSFNSSVSSGPRNDVQFYVYLIPAFGNTMGTVSLENFKLISSTQVNGVPEGPVTPR